MAMRNSLLASLADVDGEISQALKFRKSQRALERARALFAERQRIVDELADFGVHVEAHPAVWSGE